MSTNNLVIEGIAGKVAAACEGCDFEDNMTALTLVAGMLLAEQIQGNAPEQALDVAIQILSTQVRRNFAMVRESRH